MTIVNKSLILYIVILTLDIIASIDPEAFMNACQIVNYHGYYCDNHNVITKDGYIIEIQRIHPKQSNYRRPIILQHGLLCSSTNWITNLNNQSLGYILADRGYDVWLANSRGNTYARKHVKLKPNQLAFWQWSFDEMGRFDLEAVFEFVSSVHKSKQIDYIGHSQGTMIAFAAFSSNEILANKVGTFFALAPVAYLGNMNSPLRLIAQYAKAINAICRWWHLGEFMPGHPVEKVLASLFCSIKGIPNEACANIFFVIAGYDPKQLNSTRIPVYTAHNPAGTSVQNMNHYAQLVLSNRFQMYDYGTKKNFAKYGQAKPPQYNLTEVSPKTVLFWGGRDLLADPKDVKRLIKQLPNVQGSYYIPDYDHLDFIWGLNAPSKIYDKILFTLDKDVYTM